MRIKLFRIGMRDLHCILSRGVNQLGQYVTAHSTKIPEGARVHHMGNSRGGMYLDVWMEHESFPEIADYDEPAPECANFTHTMYQVIGKHMIMDNLSANELLAMREEIDRRLAASFPDTQAMIDDAMNKIYVDLGIPKREFEAWSSPDHEIKEGDVVTISGVRQRCVATGSVGSIKSLAQEMREKAARKVSEQIEKEITGNATTLPYSEWIGRVALMVGDKVRQGGGPLMEVLGIQGDKALCEWTRLTGLKDTAWFDAAELTKSSDEERLMSEPDGTVVCGTPRLKPVVERIRQGEVINAAKARVAGQIQTIAQQEDRLPCPSAVINVEAFMRD